MKNRIYTLFMATAAVLSGLGLSAQGNDDLYFDGVEEKPKKEIIVEEPIVKSDEYDRTDEEYVDESYEYEYSARIRRFHQPARGFSYYSNYYVDNYWYDPYMPGVNIYVVQPYYMHNSWGWNYPYCNGWNSYSSYGYGWSSYGGYYGYGYSPYGSYWGNASWGYRNPYWNGYNNGYWNGYNQGYWNGYYNNGWYNNGWHQHNNNWGGWFENSAPNAANFVTNRYPRSSDTELHRSRNTPVEGYDTHQRLNNNAPDNNSLNPDSRGRNLDPNTNVRPDRNVQPNPNVRPETRDPQPNVRPDRNVQPQPNVRPDRNTNPNVRPPERNTNPPVIRESNPSNRGTVTPPRTTPERSRDNNSSFNSSGSKGSSGFNSGSSGSSGSSGRSSGSSSGSSGSSGRSSGGRR